MTIEATAPRLRAASTDNIRLLVFGRLVPATFFALLGYLQFQRLASDVRALPNPVNAVAVMSGPLPAALYLLFCAIPVFIYVGRPAPRTRRSEEHTSELQ